MAGWLLGTIRQFRYDSEGLTEPAGLTDTVATVSRAAHIARSRRRALALALARCAGVRATPA
jgi:hypothetical protein